MKIREATDDDARELISMVRQGFRHISPSMVRALVTEPATADDRVVLAAVHEGRVVGAGLQFRLPEIPVTQRARYVVVADDALGTGVARALAAALDDRLDPRVADLTCTVDDDAGRGLAVARHWGFAVLQHSLDSELDLAGIPGLRLPADVTVEASPGLEFDDESEVEAMLDRSQTNPERHHNGPLTLTQLRGWHPPGSGDRPIGLLLRVDGRPAALSHGIVSDGVLVVVYTGVDPDRRGRGLARIAKEALHHAAREAGATRAVTSNEEHNAGIRHVNAQLGYRRTGGVVWLHRQLA